MCPKNKDYRIILLKDRDIYVILIFDLNKGWLRWL